MAEWDPGNPSKLQENPQTLVVEGEPYTNGDLGSLPQPGTLRSRGGELDEIRSLLEANIEVIGHLIVKVCKHTQRPTQDAEGHARQNRSLRELKDEFKRKMEALDAAVGALSPNARPNQFIERELYFLIQSVKTDDWIHLMRVLEVTESEREACQTLYPNKLEQQYQMLQIWLRKPEDGHRTHRDELVEALGLIRYEQVAQMFLKGSTRSAPQLR